MCLAGKLCEVTKRRQQKGVRYARVTNGPQRCTRSRSLGLFWQELGDEDEIAKAAVWTKTLGRDRWRRNARCRQRAVPAWEQTIRTRGYMTRKLLQAAACLV